MNRFIPEQTMTNCLRYTYEDLKLRWIMDCNGLVIRLRYTYEDLKL